ncbi:hypothetical protein NQ317_002501 [Molorchus minor]|uniref:Uncharacterized protein n=1 Tax=Molorchus minor TaxID=1323400 RepID=A0ABQ9JC47_9CUCU|nr:hypothetical protein NQ317_002501 [Molorchus minor]
MRVSTCAREALSIKPTSFGFILCADSMTLFTKKVFFSRNAIMNFHNNHVQAEKTLQEVGGARSHHLSLSTRRDIVNKSVEALSVVFISLSLPFIIKFASTSIDLLSISFIEKTTYNPIV